MLGRIFGIILAVFVAALFWGTVENLEFIKSENFSEMALIALFGAPVVLGLLSILSMYLFAFIIDILSGHDAHAPGCAGVFGVMLVHALGFFSIFVLMLNFYFTSVAIDNVLQGGLLLHVSSLFILVFIGIFIAVTAGDPATITPKNEGRRKITSIIGGVLFLISLFGIFWLVAINSSDIVDSVKGAVLLSLPFAALIPMFLVGLSIFAFIFRDDVGHVSDPEIYFPYIVFLAFSILGSVSGAIAYLIASAIAQ